MVRRAGRSIERRLCRSPSNKEPPYNKSMPKTDFEKLTEERSAATLLRDEISFMIGWTKADNPEISERLEKALKMHEEVRCKDWL